MIGSASAIKIQLIIISIKIVLKGRWFLHSNDVVLRSQYSQQFAKTGHLLSRRCCVICLTSGTGLIRHIKGQGNVSEFTGCRNTKDMTLGGFGSVYCFKLRTTWKLKLLWNKYIKWLGRNQNNVSEWSDMFISGLLFQWASAIKIQLIIISIK
jgi:hypothetical protein